MNTITLKTEYENEFGTFGTIKLGDTTIYTLELPWKNNERNVSCIPGGTYTFKPHISKKFPGSYILAPTSPRGYILIHAGNTIKDTEGCILVGLARTKTGILNSKKALKLLNETLPKGGTIVIERLSNEV